MITLQPLTDENRAALEALQVAPHQTQFVTSVTDSLAEAAEHPAAHPICWGIYDDETPVGFAMVADQVDEDYYIPQYLWKFLIDEQFQGRGYGKRALSLVVAYFRKQPGVEEITTSAHQGEGSPIGFYEHRGFERTGEVVDGEVVLRLRLQ